MQSILLNNPVEVGGTKEILHLDNTEGVAHYEIKGDVEPVLNWTKEAAKEFNAGRMTSGDGYFVGRFPKEVILAWLSQRGLKMKDFKGDVLEKFVNDPDVAAFRVWKGHV